MNKEIRTTKLIVNKIRGWAFVNSLTLIHFGAKINLFEEVKNSFSKYEFEVTDSPKQADLLVLTGPICYKGLPVLKEVYMNMTFPKWVLAVGVSNDNPFNEYGVVENLDTYLPIDLFIPGNPPSSVLIETGVNLILDKIKLG